MSDRTSYAHPTEPSVGTRAQPRTQNQVTAPLANSRQPPRPIKEIKIHPQLLNFSDLKTHPTFFPMRQCLRSQRRVLCCDHHAEGSIVSHESQINSSDIKLKVPVLHIRSIRDLHPTPSSSLSSKSFLSCLSLLPFLSSYPRLLKSRSVIIRPYASFVLVHMHIHPIISPSHFPISHHQQQHHQRNGTK